MIDLLASGDELLELGRKLKVIRHVNGEPRCLHCDEPVAWIAADPKTLEVVYCEPTAAGARPLNLCRRHRDGAL
jgi:hypothetical protein